MYYLLTFKVIRYNSERRFYQIFGNYKLTNSNYDAFKIERFEF